MAKISIIVPCYNQAQYLPEALASVVNQIHQDWECIIVNDGSTDNSEEIAKQWCDKDERIVYLCQKNAGVSTARNTGIKIAKGEFILPLDGDDKIHKEYTKNAIEIFENNKDVTLVYSEVEYFGSRQGRWHLPQYDYKSLLSENLIYSSAVYRKTDWENAGGYDENTRELEDWEFWIRLLYNERKIYKIPVVGFYYRIHDNSRNLALVYADEKRKNTENYIFSKHHKIYEEYLGSVIHNLRVILKLKKELGQIKNSAAYKLSTRAVTLINPIRKLLNPSKFAR